MRNLIILCIAAAAVAAPQGYNYASHFNSPYFFQPAAGAGSGAAHAATAAAAAAGAFNGPDIQNYQQEALISKRFFIHSAPEEDVQVEQRSIVVGQPRKNFNVVFIKSPTAAAQKTKIRILPAANEDKTVIYVLAKKAGENEVIAHVEEPYTTTAKPEVFFIKYKTNEEAEHAQNTIQAEYDRLGGSSIISNEGIAPVSSVIGSLDAASGHEEAPVVETGHGAANTAYLPPIKKL